MSCDARGIRNLEWVSALDGGVPRRLATVSSQADYSGHYLLSGVYTYEKIDDASKHMGLAFCSTRDPDGASLEECVCGGDASIANRRIEGDLGKDNVVFVADKRYHRRAEEGQ